jgi:hypothetical protein
VLRGVHRHGDPPHLRAAAVHLQAVQRVGIIGHLGDAQEVVQIADQRAKVHGFNRLRGISTILWKTRVEKRALLLWKTAKPFTCNDLAVLA